MRRSFECQRFKLGQRMLHQLVTADHFTLVRQHNQPLHIRIPPFRLAHFHPIPDEERLPLVKDRIRERLGELSKRLGDDDWLDGEFSAGDLVMVGVLRRLRASGLLDEYPNLAAYVARGEARPAFRRAFDAQLAVFEAASDGS